MAEEDDSAVVLGDGTPVEGAPLARVGARLMWGIEKSAIKEREGDTVIRTPDGPRELRTVLEEVNQPYFATQREFEDAIRGVIGSGPIPTAEETDEDRAEADVGDDEDGTEDDGANDEDDREGLGDDVDHADGEENEEERDTTGESEESE